MGRNGNEVGCSSPVGSATCGERGGVAGLCEEDRFDVCSLPSMVHSVIER